MSNLQNDPEKFLSYFPGNQIPVAALENKEKVDKLKAAGKTKPNPRHFHGELKPLEKALRKLNGEGWGVFFTVNELDPSLDPGKQRTNKMVVLCRAVWVEDDLPREKPRDDFPITPNIILESSPGKYHYYWLTSTDQFEEWNGVMATMVEEHGCDPNAKDLARFLRLPEFNHVKGDPHKVTYTMVREKPYSWEEIKEHFPPAEGRTDAKGNKKSASWKPQEDHINAIIKGENFHGSLQSIIANHANHTTDKNTLIQIARGLLAQALIAGELSDTRQARAQRMLSDDSIEIEEMVNWAIQSTEEENRVDIPKSQEQVSLEIEIDWPPGLIGQLSREIYEMAKHPNQTVAIVTGLAIVAGIVGRTFNVNKMGLNLYIALLMETGQGKDIISDAISIAFRKTEMEFLPKAPTFIGSKRFTGAKPIVRQLQEGMSRVSVFTEAGLMMDSNAGDPSGVTRTLLGIYTKSGKDQWTEGESYARDGDSIPELNAPALTIIQESTPHKFISGMTRRGADRIGELPRIMLNRVHVDKSYLNRISRTQFSPKIRERLNELILVCSQNQDTKQVKTCTELEIPEYIFEDNDRLVDLENKYRKEGKHLQQVMCTRAWVKQVKIAGVCSVFNGATDEIDRECYEWAKKAIEHEISVVSDAYTHESSSDLMGVVKNIVAPKIVDILNNKYGGVLQKSVPRGLREKGIVTLTSLRQVLLNNPTLKEMDDDASKPKINLGLDKALEYMVYKAGLLYELDKKAMRSHGSKSPKGYQITDDFSVLMEGE